MRTRFLVLGLACLIVVSTVLLANPSEVKADAVIVTCSGTEGAPTAVTEAALAGNDVTFNGSGWCELNEAISAASVTVDVGVILTHLAADNDGVTITTTGGFILNGDIIVDGKGCAGLTGATISNGCEDAGSSLGGEGDRSTGCGCGGGASYGGVGHDDHNVTVADQGDVYGSTLTPILFGSGGGDSATGTGGAGGGIVKLDIGTTAVISGNISANGGDAAGNSGGGSGGSILIQTGGAISGAGILSADGGNGLGYGGGAGGGRISVFYQSGTITTIQTNATAVPGTKGVSSTTTTTATAGTVFISLDASGDSDADSGALSSGNTDDDTWTFVSGLYNLNDLDDGVDY